MESTIQDDLEHYYSNKNILVVVEQKDVETFKVDVILFNNAKLSRDVKINDKDSYMSNICVFIKVINNMIINYFRKNEMYKMSITEK